MIVKKYCPKCSAETERYTGYGCKPCVRARAVAYRKANSEKMKARGAAYYKANSEKEKARKAAYRKENPEKSKASYAKWKKANPEKAKANSSEWRKANPEKAKAIRAAYSAGMPDSYIVRLICRRNEPLKQVQIQPEFIEAKRIEIKLKRLIKELKK